MLLALVPVALLLGLLGLGLWAIAGFQRPRTYSVEPITLPGFPGPDARELAGRALTFVSWNIAWGQGEGSAEDPARPAAEIAASIQKIGVSLRELGADVVLLQEVDFDSARSQRVDQALALARLAGLPHLACALSWRTNYLPFPSGPPRDHWGRVRSGGVILSRYPIRSCSVELLPKPSSRSAIQRCFYLFRYIQRCELAVGERLVTVYNVHLEAFDWENRADQASHLARRLSSELTPLTICGGDFNTEPPQSTIPDGPGVQQTADPTQLRIRAVAGLTDVVSTEAHAADPAAWYTYPAGAADRRLDYLYAGRAFHPIQVRVAPEVGTPSDHYPLIARLGLDDG